MVFFYHQQALVAVKKHYLFAKSGLAVLYQQGIALCGRDFRRFGFGGFGRFGVEDGVGLVEYPFAQVVCAAVSGRQGFLAFAVG